MAWWTSVAMDDRIMEHKNAGRSALNSAQMITIEFGNPVTKNMIIRQRRVIGIKPTVQHSELTEVEFVPVWESPQANALFTRDWLRGCAIKDLCARWSVSEDALRAQRKKLELHPRQGEFVPYTPRDQSNRPSRAKAVEPKASKPAPEPKNSVAPEPKTPAPPRQNLRLLSSVSGRGTSAFTYRGLGTVEHLPEPTPRAAGCCSWPLSCAEPATGRWCAEHAGLLRRRAA